MKKLITATVLLLVLAALPFSHLLMAGKMSKVGICHKGKLINVNGNSLPAHLRHGDCTGPPCVLIPSGCFCLI